MVEQRDPQVVDEAFADPGRVPALERARAPALANASATAAGGEHERPGSRFLFGHRVVEQAPEQQRRDDADDRGGDRRLTRKPMSAARYGRVRPEHAAQQRALDALARARASGRAGSPCIVWCIIVPVNVPGPPACSWSTPTAFSYPPGHDCHDRSRGPRRAVATVRRFVEREVIPVASDFEHADEYPDAIVEQMKALGLFGITIPEEYGGLGLDLLTYIGVIEELAYGLDVAVGHRQHAHDRGAPDRADHGTEEQKQRWLPRLATGEIRGCLSLSEADAGSDTRNIACRAVRDGDEYVITARRCGSRTASAPGSSRSRRAPTKASRASSSRRSRARRAVASR